MHRRTFVTSLSAAAASIGLLPASSRAARRAFDALENELGAADDTERWKIIRETLTLEPGLIHLNTGSLGAMPRLVQEGLAGFIRELEEHPISKTWGKLGQLAETVRADAAAFIGAEKDELAITANTTEGMNMVASGLKLKSGDEVLTTNHEHAGGLSCWEYLAKRDGVRIVQIKMPVPARDKAQFLELVEKHITGRTRVCSFCHVDTLTGMPLPLREISQITRPRNILFVCDGAQAPGMLNVDVKNLGVDTYASSSHKWMLAPKGSGLLYIRKEVQDRVRPVALHAGFGVYSASSGTRNIPQILAHGLAMDFHNAIGRERVESRCRELCTDLRGRLEKLPGWEAITPQKELSSGMVTFRLKKGSSSELVHKLEAEHKIVVKAVPATRIVDSNLQSENYNAIRFSTHIYNVEKELELMVEALKAV